MSCRTSVAGRSSPRAVNAQLPSIRRSPPRFLLHGKSSINNRSEMLIHRPDGRIRGRNSYGNDPHPPKG